MQSLVSLVSLGSLVCAAPRSHDYVCATSATLGSRSCKALCLVCASLRCVALARPCALCPPMAAGPGRPDVLKVFMGNLCQGVNKPMLLEVFARFGLVPDEVIVPAVAFGKMAVAFAVFNTPEEAQAAILAVNGLAEPMVTPFGIHAHRVAIMGAFINC